MSSYDKVRLTERSREGESQRKTDVAKHRERQRAWKREEEERRGEMRSERRTVESEINNQCEKD